jgi:catechol 2,3-dioxygenase-like lactoylglutathione lyase family enzyme
MKSPVTKGIHHLGLTVSKLEETAGFFKNMLGWSEVKRNEDYPAIFVSDGTIMLTLWAAKAEPVTVFDKNKNVGLHHVAFSVADEAAPSSVYERLKSAGVPIEFAPELLGPGPARHMICHEPSGIRVEVIWSGNRESRIRGERGPDQDRM